jgi:hypothetical protein
MERNKPGDKGISLPLEEMEAVGLQLINP